MNKLQYDIGFGLGARACQKSMPRIPAMDELVIEYIKNNCKEVGSSIPLLKGWHKGYEWQINQEIKDMGILTK
jgi:hypothetical protein